MGEGKHAVQHLKEQPSGGRRVRAMNGKVYEVQLLKGQPIENSVRGEQVNTFVGTLKFGELIGRYQIPHRVHARDEGYQRLPSPSRVNRLARDLHKGIVDLPTAILLSVREREPYPQLDSSGRYILKLLPNGAPPFHVVDGQHRLEALKKVMEEDPDGDWFDFLIPAVIFFGADKGVEMDQFHTVNSNAKKISTDLALDLLKTRAKQDDAYRKYLDEVGEGWKVVCQDLTERVAQRNVWRGKIRFPNDDKRLTLINSNSFVTSLRSVIDQANFAKYLPEDRAKIIDAYWTGIGKALPECFEAPDMFNIQKTVGVYVLNSLLPTALAYAQDFGSPVYEPDTYHMIYDETLRGLSGDNQVDGEAEGPDFWKVGAEGASGTYSSGAGQRVLREKIRRDLQENLREQLG